VSARRAGIAILSIAAALLAGCLAGCGAFAPIGQASPGTSHSTHGGRGGAAIPTAASAPAQQAYNISALRDPPSGKFLGVEVNGAPDSLTPVSAFAAAVGHKPDMIGQYVGWGSPFDAHAAAAAWSYGALYYISWEPYNTSVADIASGSSNGYIATFAAAVRALNVPVAISFGHEMNGNWYPWGTTGTTPAQFVTAWRLIHGIFAGVGATNVIWVWNPNDIYPVPQVRLEPYWPGDSYVDWVGITGYVGTTGPDTFATLFQPTMAEISQFTSKPFIIAETSVETGPSEVTGVNALVQSVTAHADVLGLVWFDYDKDGVDWRIESRPAIQAAFDQAIAGLQVIDPKQ
jgi:mannan endo-1,4-beta-mannosidase